MQSVCIFVFYYYLCCASTLRKLNAERLKNMATSISGNAQRELIPAGTYAARCVKLISLGNIENNFNGQISKSKKIVVVWEIPEIMKVWKEGEDAKPATIFKEYTASLGKPTGKSNLRDDLVSWRGKAFTEEERKNFVIAKLLGAPCLLNITHKPGVKDPSTLRENISSIMTLPKSMTCAPQITESFDFNLGEDFSWEKFNSLPDFFKDKIKTSDEFKAMEAITNPATGGVYQPTPEEGEDKLPF